MTQLVHSEASNNDDNDDDIIRLPPINPPSRRVFHPVGLKALNNILLILLHTSRHMH